MLFVWGDTLKVENEKMEERKGEINWDLLEYEGVRLGAS